MQLGDVAARPFSVKRVKSQGDRVLKFKSLKRLTHISRIDLYTYSWRITRGLRRVERLQRVLQIRPNH